MHGIDLRNTVVLFLALALAACAAGGGRSESGTADTVPPTEQPDPSAAQASALAGRWALETATGDPPGLRLELEIDSVHDARFRVRVAFHMQGDVGTPPDAFAPAWGTLGAGGTLTLTVRARAREEPVGELAGVLEGDTIALTRFLWVGEDQGAGGTRWRLVRRETCAGPRTAVSRLTAPGC